VGGERERDRERKESRRLCKTTECACAVDPLFTPSQGIANLPWFENASIILFLNKNDLFEEKVLKFDIGDWHPDYTGGLDYQAGLQYIQEEYFDRNENEDKTLYCHVTDATNTENVAFVWKATQAIILESKMSSSGLAM